ncbi:MAG TPA: ribonuclease P protein component [Patescibacteria group bacterium]|nr:ribonuclease P protein component [Patescibacteria group bacterium]
MLPKSERLRRAKDFALLSQKGRAVFGPLFTLRFRPSQTPTKIGFVASAKIFKTAVSRNRAKRRLREATRGLKPDWPKQMDLLFVLKPGVLTAEFPDLVAAMKHAFDKIPEAMTRPPKPRPPKARRKTSIVYREEV